MGFYSDYLNSRMSQDDIRKERQKQLKKISELRGTDVVVFAADLSKGGSDTAINYSDRLPFFDQIAEFTKKEIDIILETPGGDASVVEDLVKCLRRKFEKIGVIVPGYAKSAGTIFTMAADEILMCHESALGPIDAQITTPNGKHYSADAFIYWLDDYIEKTNQTKQIDIALLPMLRNLSPGEIQYCINAQNYSKNLVTEWLTTYKFKDWTQRETSGEPVTEEYKKARAEEIADKLCAHRDWLTHARSLDLHELRNMKLIINDYSENSALNDAITRYYTLLRMTFESNIFKIYETKDTQIIRATNNPQQLIGINNQPIKLPADLDKVMVDLKCPNCEKEVKIQGNFKEGVELEEGAIPFPKNNIYKCECGETHNLNAIRNEIVAKFGKKII